MPTPIFPVLDDDMRPDSAQYEVSLENVAMSHKTEGGYTYTRPRSLRSPRKTWKIAYRDLTDDHKAALEEFWGTVKGGSAIFDWLNHEDGETYQVRFASDQPLVFQYKGVHTHRRWNCSFSLEQA